MQPNESCVSQKLSSVLQQQTMQVCSMPTQCALPQHPGTALNNTTRQAVFESARKGYPTHKSCYHRRHCGRVGVECRSMQTAHNKAGDSAAPVSVYTALARSLMLVYAWQCCAWQQKQRVRTVANRLPPTCSIPQVLCSFGRQVSALVDSLSTQRQSGQ